MHIGAFTCRCLRYCCAVAVVAALFFIIFSIFHNQATLIPLGEHPLKHRLDRRGPDSRLNNLAIDLYLKANDARIDGSEDTHRDVSGSCGLVVVDGERDIVVGGEDPLEGLQCWNR